MSKLFVQCLSRGSRSVFGFASLHTGTPRYDIFKIQDEADFQQKVLENKKLVILDFYASWCGPCKILTPRLETLIGANSSPTEGVDLAKVDVDILDNVAGQYNVSAIPSVFAIKNGKVVDQFVGLKDDDQLNSFISNALKK